MCVPVPDAAGDDSNNENKNAENNYSFFGDGCCFLQFLLL